jgi:AcrR family transcriptional regulator
MARPSRTKEKRDKLLPVVVRTFIQLGYRRTTTAELASQCGVQETVLYRLWPDKRAMFIAAIDYVYQVSVSTWEKVLARDEVGSTAERLLAYESSHFGEFGNFRIIFTGLSETDDPLIRQALASMYERYMGFIQGVVVEHRAKGSKPSIDTASTAWALVGLGTVLSIARELKLMSGNERRKLMAQAGSLLLGARKKGR